MAGKSDGTVIIDTRMSTDGFSKGVGAMKKQVGGLNGAISKLGKTIAVAFAVGKLFQFGKEAIDLGSDLQEVQNVVDVTFTTMSDKVNEFAKNAAESAGLSETMAKRYAGTFGAMAKAFGFAEEESFGMATALTQLSGDVASFYNLTQDEAYTKLKSVFTGETETLKDLGVVMTQNALDSFAMAKGYGKTTKAMSEQEKVSLRYAFVLEQLSAAQGDFVRTSDSWANQTRILSLNFDSFKANIGQALINIFTPFLKVLNQIVAKMAEFSKGFVAFSEMLVGKSTSGGGGSPGEALEGISDGYSDIADATEEAKKAQDKYLTGLDEIKTFQTNKDVGVSDVGGIGVINPVETEEVNEEAGKTSTILDKLIEKAKELKDLFKQGFLDGLGDPTERINSIKESFESIKQSLSNIFDADFADGIEDYVNRITESFGVMSGSFASIGLTIGTNLLGGISGYLEDEAPNIKQYLLDMFDIGAELSEKGAELSSAFAYIFESFASEDGQQITEDLIAIFANPFMRITELLGQFSLDITNLLVTPFANSKEQIKTGLDDLLSGLSDFTGSVRQILDEAFSLIDELYTTHISPIFENLIPDMEALWQEHISPLFSKIGEFFSVVGDNLSALWNDLFKPFIQWFSDYIMPVIAPILEAVGRTFIDVFGTIADVLGGFLDILGGLISILVGQFTGDWQRVWDGIKSIFTGIWNSLTSAVETFINSSINLINGLIDGINNITGAIGIPAIPTIPEFNIPMLATGAVIPPNAPFMAVLGDQRRGTNIEAPLSTIESALDNVLNRRGGSSGSMTIHNVMQVNRRTLYDEFIEEAKLRMSTTGRNPFDLA